MHSSNNRKSKNFRDKRTNFLLLVLVAAISRPGMNEIWLAGVSGAVLVTLLALQVTLSFHLVNLHEDPETSGDPSSSRSNNLHTGGPLAAASAVCFFIYMAYALLPIRLRHACIAGIVFSVAHLIGIFLLYRQDYPSLIEHVSLNTFFKLKKKSFSLILSNLRGYFDQIKSEIYTIRIYRLVGHSRSLQGSSIYKF